MNSPVVVIAAGLLAAWLAYRVYHRLLLSRAKHRSLRGHNKLSRAIAKLVPYYEYDEDAFFASDGAGAALVERRKAGFERLAERLRAAAPKTIAATEALAPSVSDMSFTGSYRVPFQYRAVVRRHLRTGSLASATDGVRVCDLDGNWAYDLAGSYGVNLLGNEFYKRCIERAVAVAGELGPVLGPYHPVVADNVTRLKEISGLDEVSMHMSGTEAVMQAVRLARYHTGRPRTVVFCGAYHGWWDGVQPGIGSQRRVNDVYTLEEMSKTTLRVLDTRKDIACVLVNPLQALNPNAGASSDGTLVDSGRSAHFDRAAYAEWLADLRQVCTRRGIVLILDEVFLGFRLGLGGAQEYFGVRADMVTYGKTLGGGLPVGVLTGRRDLMKRYRDDRPVDVCFARGTFNSHPYVMAAMNEFLKAVMEPEAAAAAEAAETVWNRRAARVNERLAAEALPVRVANLSSVWTLTYREPGRYNWMLQYYLRAEGLALSWIGTGRFIFSHDYTDEAFGEVADRLLAASRAMQADGWWTPGAQLTNKSIRRTVLREMLAARLKRRAAAKPDYAMAGSSSSASDSTPSRT